MSWVCYGAIEITIVDIIVVNFCLKVLRLKQISNFNSGAATLVKIWKKKILIIINITIIVIIIINNLYS